MPTAQKWISAGANLLFDHDQPGWITVSGVDNTDYFNQATQIAADILK